MTLARSATLTMRHPKEFGASCEFRRINFSSDVIRWNEILRYAHIVKYPPVPHFRIVARRWRMIRRSWIAGESPLNRRLIFSFDRPIRTSPLTFMDLPDLERLVTLAMPFGKYKGRLIADLPGHYLNWFAREGFPPGEIGRLLALMQELDHNGLRTLLDPLRKGGKAIGPKT